jgi:hypothetical protein
MRKALTCLSLLILFLLACAVSAAAAPVVTITMTPVPIPHFAGTGDILGAGTDVEARSTISGTEYGGFPSPLVLLTVNTPAGTNVTFNGFAACAPEALEANGAAGCPKQSVAGPLGEGLGVVSFGGERVNEKVTIQPFFGPANSLMFYVVGSTPASFQIIEKAYWVTATAPYGPKLVVDVPLVETVPGANDASILSFKIKVGAAYKRGKKTISYFTVPKKCPKEGFAIKTELGFESGETVTIPQREPCPKR